METQTRSIMTGDECGGRCRPAHRGDALRVLGAWVRAFADGFVALHAGPIYLVELGYNSLPLARSSEHVDRYALLTLWFGFDRQPHSRGCCCWRIAVDGATGRGSRPSRHSGRCDHRVRRTINPTSGAASIFQPLERRVDRRSPLRQQNGALFARYRCIAGRRRRRFGGGDSGYRRRVVGFDRVTRSADVRGVRLFGVASLMCFGHCRARWKRKTSTESALGQSRRLVYGLAALFDGFIRTGFLVQCVGALAVSDLPGLRDDHRRDLFWSGICSAIRN